MTTAPRPIAPPEPANLVPNRPTPEGRALGQEIARFADAEVAKGKADGRCASCAFRAGTVPNGCAQSLMDALKCALDRRPFLCHERPAGEEPSEVCGGWELLAGAGGAEPVAAFWPFSDEPPDTEPGPVAVVALCWHCDEPILEGQAKRHYGADLFACGDCAAYGDEWAAAHQLSVSPHDGDSAEPVG